MPTKTRPRKKREIQNKISIQNNQPIQKIKKVLYFYNGRLRPCSKTKKNVAFRAVTINLARDIAFHEASQTFLINGLKL
ncbi:hypothetical protein NQ318_008487 [Aromia moschata]|uniref:Ribosomal protein S18 n=1 Tax=Aromia moschata TaxID=1265417 RepID=A0AAV8YBE7_9CUCU|nr:hypothetical protein NQ318_008487 [Aromia moschata]